jgi:hypothetical protein
MDGLSALQRADAWVVALVMFILIFGFYFLGHRLRRISIQKNPKDETIDLGAVNGMLLGLLGLILAFTFSMANTRFDARRELMIKEANAIGTAILRADLYPDSVRRVLRDVLKAYLNERIIFYEAGMNFQEAKLHYLEADRLGKKAWSTSAAFAKKDANATIASELIPALNDMIDITTTRRAAGEETIPDSILYFLFLLCLTSTFLLGYDNKGKADKIVISGLATMLALTLFTIIDLDRPRSGFINLDVPHQKIVELREMFTEQ